jgi:ABC-type transport system involved in multi-copper enzyme maturation permease subunit
VTALTIAALTLREAYRRKVIWGLAVLTLILLVLNGWGFASLAGMDTQFGQMTSGEARLLASQLLNLVMFAMSLIVALGAAFLAGPTLSGEVESGIALAVLARPIRRTSVLFGKWLGLSIFACGYVVAAGLVEFIVVRWAAGYWPPSPLVALVLLSAEAVTLLTLALLLSSLISPMASGVVAVGLFGAAWVAGVVGGVGNAIRNDHVERVGTIGRILLPTDGLWHGAMNAMQDNSVVAQFPDVARGSPFLGASAPTWGYLAWVVLWLVMVGGVCALSFSRRDV